MELPIKMIKTCGYSITFPLKLIFKYMINEGVFPKDYLMLFQFIKKNKKISIKMIDL